MTNTNVFCIVINYIADLQNRLRLSNDAQASMLNSMHEGVLIVDQDYKTAGDDKVLFCNWPALKILQTFISPSGCDAEDLMSKLSYQPIQDNTLMTFLTKDPDRSNRNPKISLEMIIMMQKDEPN